jgi:hypothetical protein
VELSSINQTKSYLIVMWYQIISNLSVILVHRNGRGKDRLFVGQRHPVFSFFEGLYEGERSTEVSIMFYYMILTVW